MLEYFFNVTHPPKFNSHSCGKLCLMIYEQNLNKYDFFFKSVRFHQTHPSLGNFQIQKNAYLTFLWYLVSSLSEVRSLAPNYVLFAFPYKLRNLAHEVVSRCLPHFWLCVCESKFSCAEQYSLINDRCYVISLPRSSFVNFDILFPS